VAAFSRERGLCAPHFFDWKKKLSEVAAPGHHLTGEVFRAVIHRSQAESFI
jgi:hypothetical protein